MEEHWFGADWDSKKCVVAFKKNGRLHRRNVKRHPEAVAAFLKKFGSVQTRVGIECGDPLWPRLWRNAGAEVFVFDGKKTKRFGQSLHASGASDDKRSAETLLAMVQSEPHRAQANTESSGSAAALQRLLTMADDASVEVSRYENRLRALVRQLHPALALVLGRSLQSQWLLRALAVAPTPRAWCALGDEAKNKALSGSSKESRPSLMKAFGEDWGTLDTSEEQVARLQVKLVAKQLGEALAHHKHVMKALVVARKKCAASPVVERLPGVGPYLGAAVTIALELADPNARDSLAIQFAAAPVTRRSGVTGDRQPSVRMRRAAPRAMKKATHLLGFQLVGNYRWAKAQYKFYRAKGKKGADAFRRVVRSFLRIVGALHRTNTTFDEPRYIQTLQRKGVPWAMALDTHKLNREPESALSEPAPC